MAGSNVPSDVDSPEVGRTAADTDGPQGLLAGSSGSRRRNTNSTKSVWTMGPLQTGFMGLSGNRGNRVVKGGVQLPGRAKDVRDIVDDLTEAYLRNMLDGTALALADKVVRGEFMAPQVRGARNRQTDVSSAADMSGIKYRNTRAPLRKRKHAKRRSSSKSASRPSNKKRSSAKRTSQTRRRIS